VVSAGTLVFEATFRPLLLPIPDGWHPDAWIALLLSAVTTIVPLPDRLLRYRQHPEQLHGATERRETVAEVLAGDDKSERYQDLASAYRQALDRLVSTRRRFAAGPRAVALLRQKIAHLEARAPIHSHGSGV